METIEPVNGAVPRMAALADTRGAANAILATPDDAAQPDSAQTAESLTRMCFRIGPLGLLFSWQSGREVLAPPRVSHVPNTVSWLAGMANVRGGLVPVVDAAMAFGVARQAGVPTYLLIFGHGEAAMGFLIDGLPRLLTLTAAERLPELPQGPALLEGSIAAAYSHADRIWLDLDLETLFDTLSRHIAL